MSQPESNPPQQCPSCGATLAAEADHCWVCRWELHRRRTEGETPAADACTPHAPREGLSTQPHAEREEYIRNAATPAAQPASFQFGLSSLLLIMTLSSVWFSVMAMAPGVGIVLAILAIPPLVRTWRVAHRRQAQGYLLSVRDRIHVFFAALCMVILIGMVAGIAFAATCFTGLFGGFAVNAIAHGDETPIALGAAVGTGLGLIAAAAVAAFLFRRLWPKGDQPLSAEVGASRDESPDGRSP
jgi:hypothetical protein